jgi:hypothetical protein
MAVVAGATDTLAILFGSGLLILNAGPLCSKGRDTAVTRCISGSVDSLRFKRSVRYRLLAHRVISLLCGI